MNITSFRLNPTWDALWIALYLICEISKSSLLTTLKSVSFVGWHAPRIISLFHSFLVDVVRLSGLLTLSSNDQYYNVLHRPPDPPVQCYNLLPRPLHFTLAMPPVKYHWNRNKSCAHFICVTIYLFLQAPHTNEEVKPVRNRNQCQSTTQLR